MVFSVFLYVKKIIEKFEFLYFVLFFLASIIFFLLQYINKWFIIVLILQRNFFDYLI